MRYLFETVCVCVCVCVYISIYVYIYTHKHTHTYKKKHSFVELWKVSIFLFFSLACVVMKFTLQLGD